MLSEKQGIVMIYTGDGKGKTTAAMGLVLRALGNGQQVLVAQFMKGQPTGEVVALEQLFPQVQLIRSGRDVFVNPDSPDEEDVRLAGQAVAQVARLLREKRFDLVVLDELNVAVDYGLVSESTVLDLLADRPRETSFVLTGRGASSKLQETADMVSELREIKHHWRQGIPAQAGIEF